MNDTPDVSTSAAGAAGPGVAQAAAVSAAAADATRPDAAGPDAAARPQAAAADQAQRQPPRPAAEVRADIVKERAALGASFDALRDDLDDAVDSGRRRVANMGRKAKIAAPAVGAAIFVALFLRSRARDRR